MVTVSSAGMNFFCYLFSSFEWMLAVCRRLASSKVNEASAENLTKKKKNISSVTFKHSARARQRKAFRKCKGIKIKLWDIMV